MKWSEAFEETLGMQTRLQVLIWGAMTASIVVHIILTYILTTVVPVKLAGIPDFLPTVLFVLALVEAGGSILFRRYRIAPARISGILRNTPDIDQLSRRPKGGGVDEALRGKVVKMSDLEQRLFGLLLDLSHTNLICLALNEATVLMGLLVGMMRQQFAAIFPFAILGLCLNLIMIPKTRDLLTELASKGEHGDSPS